MPLPKLIAILGPTASGKTELGIRIAKEISGEIISVDSRQMFRGMDIGTGKAVLDKVASGKSQVATVHGIPHFGIDILNPNEEFTAHQFKEFAEEKIEEILARGHVPMLVGGTGLYAQAIIDNFTFEQTKGEAKYDVLQIGLSVPRDELYSRIDARVHKMIDAGLVDEVRQLREKYSRQLREKYSRPAGSDVGDGGSSTEKTAKNAKPHTPDPRGREYSNAMTGIGYRQVCEHLDGKIDLEEATRIIKRDSRHYAKRQMTWFKRDGRIKWVEDGGEAMKLAKNFLK